MAQPKRRRLPLAAAGAIGVFLTLAGARGASAHAAFVSADPEPGARLATAPGVVTLRFKEPLNETLSRLDVTGPSGQRITGRAAGQRELRASLTSSSLGVFTVSWVTVSTVDGHTLRGSYRFGVGVEPGPGAEGATGFAPQAGDLLVAVARAVEFGALLLATGMLVLSGLARREPSLGWLAPPLRAVLAVAFAGGLLVVVGESVLAAGNLSFAGVADYLGTGLPGAARATRVAAEALALVAVGRPPFPATLVAISLGALSAAGHAAAVRPLWWGVGVDFLHLVAAGSWAGAIGTLALVRPPGGWRGTEARVLLNRFSPVALGTFAVTVGAGVLRGAQELRGFGDLLASSYGLVLSIKVLLVVAMVPLSVLAWRRVAGSPRLEAGVAAAVVILTALLAAYPLPPGRLGEAEAAVGGPELAGLPAPADLSLGRAAGEVLIGLTLRPARPGPNEVLVYVLPLEGEKAAGGVRVSLDAGAGAVVARACGPTCRRAEMELSGGERIEVLVGGAPGGKAVFQVPSLPPPDGSRLFSRAQTRMHALHTFRLDERLSSGRAVVRSTWEFQAPDRMRSRVEKVESIQIGSTRWSRQGGGSWNREARTIPLEVPTFIWDFARGVRPRVLGTEQIDGASTTTIAFFGRSGQTPIWFRLWLDMGGLVRRAEMRAHGHFMDHRYFDFDAPFTITPPAGGSR